MKQVDTTGISGLTRVADLYQQAKVDSKTERLYLDRKNDIDIPLLPDEHVILHGDEVIIAGEISGDIGDNPTLRNPVELEFNGTSRACGDKAKLTSEELCKLDAELDKVYLFADLKGAVDIRIAVDLKLVLQDTDSFFTIPAGDGGEIDIDLEACGKHDRRPPRGQQSYRIRIDGEKYRVGQEKVAGQELMNLAGKNYEGWTLNQKLRGGRRKSIAADETVDLTEPGIERFETVQRQAQQGQHV